jgi:hypothetical protein
MPGEIDAGVREGPCMVKIVPWNYKEKINVLLMFEQLFAGLWSS